MSTVDTNVLIRILIDDPSNKKQCERAREFVSTLKQLYIPQIVQIEFTWVLTKTYEFTKEQIIFVLKSILNNGAFKLEKRNIFIKALSYYQQYNVSFADLIILAEAEENDALPLVTFDKKLGKLTNAQLV